MSLTVTCPDCDKKLKVKDELAGRKLCCPACATVISVPAASTDLDEGFEDDPFDDAPPVRKRRRVKVDFDDEPVARSRPRKSVKKPRSRATSGGPNWWLIGGLTGGGLVLILFVAMLVTSVNQARKPVSTPVAWPTFRHPSGSVQIDMPGTPVLDAQQSARGSQTYTLKLSDHEMSLVSGEFDPSLVSALETNRGVVDLMFNEMEKKTPQLKPGTKVLSSRRLTTAAYPGLEMRLESQGNVIMMRFYITPKAMIGAGFTTRNESAHAADCERFFQSLRGPDGNLVESPPQNPGSSPMGNQPAVASTAPDATASYLDRLAKFKTKLTRQGPSPQPYQRERPPTGVQEVTYQSGTLSLKAWVAFPRSAAVGTKVPAVVYFHGGFAFGVDDFKDAQPFLDAGYAVMCPMLRGENGNPGNFELYCGEVDDAKAAVNWMAGHERVDASHLYTFGHSAGGVLSCLLSLHDVPIRHGGSSGGLYGTSLFDYIRDTVPFSIQDQSERQMRVLVGNIKWMKHPHHAYVGVGDELQEVASAKREIQGGQPLLQIIPLPGDHHTSLRPSVQAYIGVIKANP